MSEHNTNQQSSKKNCWIKIKDWQHNLLAKINEWWYATDSTDYIIAIISIIGLYLFASNLSNLESTPSWDYIPAWLLGIWVIVIIIRGYKKTKSTFSFLTILDIVILILLGTLIVLLYRVITKQLGLFNDNSVFVIISFTLALAALIPYLISRTIAKSEIDKLVDEKVEMLFNKKITELENINNTSLHNLTKQSAHSARITAKILANSSNDDDSKWAIGWASQALIRYMQINYKPESVFYKDCITIISDSIEGKKPSESEITPDAQKKTRAYVDLLDMFLLYMSSAKNHFMGNNFDTIKEAINNKYSKSHSLDQLFEKSKFYEYTHTELPEDKQKAHFKRLLTNHGINYKKSNDIDNTQ